MSLFYSLPRELRDEIYKFSLPQHDPSDESTWTSVECCDDLSVADSLKILENSLHNGDTRASKDLVLDTKNEVQWSSSQIFPLPPICLASKTTYNEAVPLFLQSSTIYCSGPNTTQDLLDWLAKFSHSDGYGSIRSLAIQYGMVSAREHKVVGRSFQQDLFGKCTNLRYLTLVFGQQFDDLVASKLYKPRVPHFEPSKVTSIVETYQFEEVVAIPMLEKLVLDFSSAYRSCGRGIPERLNDWYAGRWKEERRAVAIECKLDEDSDDGHTGWMMFD